MEIRQLRYFLNAAKTLNFTEAARLSYVAQSTLSQQIKQLEAELGTPLFDRVGKRIMLTEDGKAFVPFVQQTIQDAEDGVQRLQDMRELTSGRLRIGVAYGLSSVLNDTLEQFSREYPLVQIEIRYEQATALIELLHEREIDFAITFNLLDLDDEIAEEPLFASRLQAIVSESHALTRKTAVGIDDLKRHLLALTPKGMNARRLVDNYAAQHRQSLKPSVEINEVFTLLNLIRSGHWIGVLSDAVLIGQQGLVALPLADAEIPMQISVLTLKGVYQRKAVTTFLHTLQQCVSESMWGKEKLCPVCGQHFIKQ